MNTIEHIKEQYQRRSEGTGAELKPITEKAFEAFSAQGIPTTRHEEWKYTRISSLFHKDYFIAPEETVSALAPAELDPFHLPGHEEANVLVFLNGAYAADLSQVRSAELVVLPLEDAARGEYAGIVTQNLGHSSRYNRDGIHALNTAFVTGGVFIHVKRNQTAAHPIYFYYFTDAREANILAQPRTLVHVAENAEVQMVETYATLGSSESFTNQVIEIVLERDARVEYYKIQNDAAHTHQVGTTHFRQVGKSYLYAVTISLNGGIVRNNLNIALEAERGEAHLYGLYFLQGHSHVDNHTVVDHAKPNCESNELYKGIVSDTAQAVFNGKIFVREDAQKTNAYQSNKNVLLTEGAGVNTKPQLEIFADDVKCSHGCTVGQLDEEGLFYLRSRGISEKTAKALLVHAFAMDILEKIRPENLRRYVDKMIADRLQFDFS